MHKLNPSMRKWIIVPFILGFIFHIHFSLGQNSYPVQQGKWLKIAVTQSQFYHLNKAWFSKNKVAVTSAKNITIYGTKAGMLDPNAEIQTGFLQPIPAYYQNMDENAWEILFWGDSPHTISQEAMWAQETNRYSDTTFYFVRIDAPKNQPIEEINPPKGSGPVLNFAYGLKHYEPETFNLIQSGQTWLGDAFYGSGNKFLQYNLPDYAEGKSAFLDAKFYASSVNASSFSLPSVGKSINLSPITGGRYDKKANSETIKTWITPLLSAKNWSLPIQFQSNGGTGYIDYLSLIYPRTIDAKNSNPLYLLPNVKDSTMHISIPNLTGQQQIWINNGGMRWNKLASTAAFQFTFRPNSRLAIADISTANEPIFCASIENLDALNIPVSTELLILSAPPLRKEAEKLANYKSTVRGIQSSYVSTATVYQDFSGGKQDVVAIRNFIRYQYSKPGSKLKYVILLGDASIDYKGQNVVSTALEKSCFVPTYQSKESLQPLLSYASDDFYGIVGSDAGDWEENTFKLNSAIQVAVGRIPAKNPQEANMFINKLMDYEDKPRKRATQFAWVADDGDANIHMQDAEDFSNLLLQDLLPGQQHKVYLDQFVMNQSNGVYTSPSATTAVKNLFEDKADFIHYTGHGSESGLADEKLLTTNDIVGLKNNQNLPILLTATCQFGRFDDPNILSGGEVSLLSDQGGAIALISTTRPVFQSSNYLFGQAFYRAMIANQGDLKYRLGDLFRDAKNQSQSGVINRNIQLLGDPSLMLPWAAERLNIELDSAKQVLSVSGNELKNHAITIQLHRVADSKKTLGTKEVAFQYKAMSPIIWKSSVIGTSNNQNINLSTLPNLTEENAYQLLVWSTKGMASIPIKSWKNKQSPDQTGPKITIDLLNERIQSSSSSPTLKFTFADSSGLAWQDKLGKVAYIQIDDSLKIEVAPIVQLQNANPRVGIATLNLTNLKKGNHKIQVFCWDIHNNSASQTLEFQVVNDDDNLYGRVYPNPLGRTFHFVFEQNKPWNKIPYELELTNILGQTILKRMGYGEYQDSNVGLITFDWSEDEWQKMNQILLLKISLTDELKNEKKIFRIKTTTLK